MYFNVLSNGNLEIGVLDSDESRALLADLVEATASRPTSNTEDLFLSELLEATGWQPNGRLYLVPPELVGALTDSPILSDELDYPDEGPLRVGACWWYPQYENSSIVQVLQNEGKVVFSAAD